MTCSFCKRNEAIGQRDYGDGNGKRPICQTCVLQHNAMREAYWAKKKRTRAWTAEDEARDDRNRRDL